MPNTENFNKVIAHLEKYPKNFWMELWAEGLSYIYSVPSAPPCGSIMCMGGTCAFIMLTEGETRLIEHQDVQTTIQRTSQYEIAEWLGISPESIRHLFFMKRADFTQYGEYNLVTVDDAIRMLKYARDTGICNEAIWRRLAPHTCRNVNEGLR